MAEQEQNRNEAATPHKLEEARKKGNVPKSLDINSWAVLFAVLAAFSIWGHRMVSGELFVAHQVLSSAYDISFEFEELAKLLTNLIVDTLLVLSPLFFILFVVGFLANFFQVGPVFSFFPLKPDLERINPVAGFKRLFSIKMLIESIKTVLKFVILGWVLYLVVMHLIPKFIMSFYVSPVEIGSILYPAIGSLLFKLVLALAFIALLDLVFSRWDFSRRLRMSRREILDEHKRREGDPRLKSRLRELQREAVKRAKSLGRIKDADVLVTNPTHIAIAIKYDKEIIDAPVVIAKGAGFLAGRMRAIARKHRVPIIENKILARSLFHKVNLEQAVPAEYFGALAKILFWTYSLKGKLSPLRRGGV